MAGGYKQIHKHPNAGTNNLKHRPEDRYNSLVKSKKKSIAKQKAIDKKNGIVEPIIQNDSVVLRSVKDHISNKVLKMFNDSAYIEIPKENVTIKPNGNVILKVANETQMLLRMNQIAIKGNNADSLRAIDWLITRGYGKPKEHIEIETKDPVKQIIYKVVDAEGNDV